MSTKNSSDAIGNRTRDLPACSTVPQPPAPPRTPSFCILDDEFHLYFYFFHNKNHLISVHNLHRLISISDNNLELTEVIISVYSLYESQTLNSRPALRLARRDSQKLPWLQRPDLLLYKIWL